MSHHHPLTVARVGLVQICHPGRQRDLGGPQGGGGGGDGGDRGGGHGDHGGAGHVAPLLPGPTVPLTVHLLTAARLELRDEPVPPQQPPQLVPPLPGEGEDQQPDGDAEHGGDQGQQQRLVDVELVRQAGYLAAQLSLTGRVTHPDYCLPH